jgi:hypothetical protein
MWAVHTDWQLDAGRPAWESSLSPVSPTHPIDRDLPATPFEVTSLLPRKDDSVQTQDGLTDKKLLRG